MREYLLGKLPENEAVAVEEKYFADRAFLLHLHAAESALIREYLDGLLHGADLRLFESRYLAVPELKQKLDFIRRDHRPAAAPKPVFSGWLQPAFAALVVIALGAGSFYLLHRSHPEAPAIVSEVRPPASPAFTEFRLEAGISKSAQSRQSRLSLPRLPGRVAFNLKLPGVAGNETLAARLSRIGSQGKREPVWTGVRPIELTGVGTNSTGRLMVDSTLLLPSDYLLEVVSADGTTLETFTFRAFAPAM